MKMKVALDSNLLLLLIVGLSARHFISKHRRLKSFVPEDFDLLVQLIEGADSIVATPNALSEVSNLLEYGVSEPLRSVLYQMLSEHIQAVNEEYVASRDVARLAEFLDLGLSDCAWLACLDTETIFLTDELPLFNAASSRGIVAYNFTHLRQERGLLPL